MYILQLQNITKKYPGVVALNDVSLDVIKGEVHALVGENGAGNSTLIKTCTGAVVPDQGKVIIEGREFSSLTPTSSKENGIAVIYQEFNLVGELSVAENIFLGRAIRKGVVIDNKAMVKESAAIFKQFEINIDPNALVSTLTVGYQQLVEIAKAICAKGNGQWDSRCQLPYRFNAARVCRCAKCASAGPFFGQSGATNVAAKSD